MNSIESAAATRVSMDWSSLRAGRARAYQVLPRLQAAPLIAGAETLIRRHVKANDRVLDVGAHDRRIERFLGELAVPVIYRSLDVDRSLPHDYYGFDEVDGRFDLVTLLDVVEHLPPETISRVLADCHAVLKPGGRIVITTPNVSHPVRLWRDCSHITPVHHAELAGFVLSASFVDPKLFRIREMTWKDWLLYPVVWPALKFLEIDFAFGIALTAVRPPD